jgi:myo-inositol 2-dehydrogenase/D-chiro-inositol 1-dehydrogenase
VVADADRRRATGHPADWRPRFADAYRMELQAWVDAVASGRPTPLATARDGLAAGAAADAVIASMHDGGRTVVVEPPALDPPAT